MIPVSLNWHESPFVRILLPFAGGVLLQEKAGGGELPFHVLTFCAISGAIVMLWLAVAKIPYAWRMAFGIASALTWFSGGWIGHFYADQRKLPHHYSHFLHEHSVLTGHVRDLKIRRERLRAEVKIYSILDSLGNHRKVTGVIHLFVPASGDPKSLEIGDWVAFKGWVNPTEPVKNPYAFDYQTYLKRRHIHFQVFADSTQWKIIQRGNGFHVKGFLERCRSYCLDILARHLPSEEGYGVASALILGYREATPEALENAFAATGATHVLAVSGLHVGIVQLILASLLQIFEGRSSRKRRWIKTGILILGVWTFALLTGGAGSTLRAATMFSLLSLGKAIGRGISPYNSLAASAFLLIALDTNRIFDVGFQLSYLAVGGIVFLYPRIFKLWYISGRAGNYLWQLTALSLSATMVTAPISLMYFHQFPIYFWLSGLIAVPLSGVILGLGLWLFAVDWIPFVGTFSGKILDWSVWLLNESILLVESMPYHLISGVWVSETGVWALYSAMFAFAFGVALRNFRWILAGLSILCAASLVHATVVFQKKSQREIILYHVRGNTVLDCVDGDRVISLHREAPTTQDMQFSIQNYRWNRRVREVQKFSWQDNPGRIGQWFYRNGVLEFSGIRIAAVNSSYRMLPSKKLETDFLILDHDSETTVESLLKIWEVRKAIIFDSGNSRYKVKKWMQECARLQIKFHDVGTTGAWRFIIQ